MKKYILTATCCLSFFNLSAQLRRGIFPSIGIVYQREVMADLSLIRMEDDLQNMYNPDYRGSGIHSTSGIRLGFETNFNSSHLIAAPKIGAELNVLYLCLRINLIDYWAASEGTHDGRIVPELGITNFGDVLLTFGYNIHTAGYRNEHISGAKLSLLVNLNRPLLRDLWGRHK